MSPKFTMLIRFTLEIFLLLVLAADFRASTSPETPETDETSSESQEHGPKGTGTDTVRVSMHAAGGIEHIRFKSTTAPFTGLDALAKVLPRSPDRVAIEVSGDPRIRELLKYALENEIPVSIEVAP